MNGQGILVNVAPRAGAWIETANMNGQGILVNVAPRAGAWIETSERSLLSIMARMRSPPVRGRGLKQCHALALPGSSARRRPPCGGVD